MWKWLVIFKRLVGVEQELKDLKKDVNSSLAEFKSPIGTKVYCIKRPLGNIEENFYIYICDVITKKLYESIISVKDSIIDALKILSPKTKLEILKTNCVNY